MGRIVAIDYGTKRVGLAATDPLKIIASPIDTIHSKDVIQYLKNYDEKEGIETFVLGMPKDLSNEDTNATTQVRHFLNLLKKHFPATRIELVDERFTSKMAMSTMISGGVKKMARRNKETIDKISATIILQSYLESSSR
jgi:putative holliday junction resolvase